MRLKNSEQLKIKSKECSQLRRAIKEKCSDCVCGQKIDCMVADCPLYNLGPRRGI